jgi:uncharacterized protein involved in exopolysaccharide biosynthesis
MVRTENYRRELLFIFFAHKKFILFVTLIILALSILIALYWPKTYAAYGSVLVTGKKLEKSPEAIEESDIRSYPVSKEDLFSEVQIMTSFEVIEQTIKNLLTKKLYNLFKNREKGFKTIFG